MRWSRAYKAGVLVLLALILAQLSGLIDLKHDLRAAASKLHSLGRAEELPAPTKGGGGLLDLHTDEILRDAAEEERRRQQQR